MDVEVGEAGPDGELHARAVQVRGELLGRAGGVGAHQHRNPAVLVGAPHRRRHLGQRGIQHRDVVGGGVRPGLTRAKQLRDRLAAPAVMIGPAVINEPE